MQRIDSANSINQPMIAQIIVDEIPALIAYVDNDQRYRFANKAYLNWFGREKNDILELSMKDVIGSIYDLNLPYIANALEGSLQVFERKVVTPDGSVRYGLMTYTPNYVEDKVEGFFIHVVDVTPVKKIEKELHVERENTKEVLAKESSSLRQANKVFKHFGVLCNEVTAQLSKQEITESFYNHVRQILDFVGFSIFFLDQKKGLLYPFFSRSNNEVEHLGDALPFVEDSCLYRCITTKQTVIENSNVSHPSFRNRYPFVGSLMVTPLLDGDAILGVMLIQARLEDAYGDREKLILKALSTYLTNTLVNANAYQQLQDTKTKLVEQEKMASLGSMISCFASTLSTPIGNSILASTNIDHDTHLLKQLLDSSSLKKSDLERLISNLDSNLELSLSNIHRAARIIDSFKNLSVDQSTENLEFFSIHDLCVDVIEQTSKRLEYACVDILLDDGPEIRMHSFPHSLGLVLLTLIDNALRHAFSEDASGYIQIAVKSSSDGQLQITVSDNGSGIQEVLLDKIFEPFFTTKMSHGYNGLGLNIIYNQVVFVLKGSIEVESEFGVGTRFILDLPISIPNLN